MTSTDTHAMGFMPQAYTREVTADVERRITESFRRCGDIDWREIHVDVDGERAALTGTASTSLQRWAAEYAASDSPGIARVDDRLVVRPAERQQRQRFGRPVTEHLAPHRLSRAAARVAVVCALLVHSGCASRQPYPAAWTALEASRDCAQIAGDYRNNGEDAANLHVDIKAADDGWSSRVLPHEQFACRNGTLVVKPGARWFGNLSQFGFFVIGRGSLTLELHRAASHLVVKSRTSATGVIVVVPAKSTDEKWHRFERLED
jgi:hypothetical protein